jgi:hypothetical protein
MPVLCFWTLSIILSLSKKNVLFMFKTQLSETGFCLRLQVKPTLLGLIDRASPYLRTPVSASRWGKGKKKGKAIPVTGHGGP